MSTITCTRCGCANGQTDRYCGSCGAALAELRWRSSGNRVNEGEGHLVVRASVPTAVARLTNRGVGAALVVLREPAGSTLPSWIDAQHLPRAAFAVAAGAEVTVEIALNPLVLQGMFGQPSTEARRTETADAELHFRTTLSQHSGESAAPVELTLRVLIARDPWITPAASHYPFLAWERLLGLGIAHVIEFHNEAAEPICLKRVEIGNSPLSLGKAEQRMDAAALLRVEHTPSQVAIQPGAASEIALRLSNEAPPTEGGAASWFSASVKFHYTTGLRGERVEVASATIDGFIGKAPRLVFDEGLTSRSLPLSAPPENPIELTLTNPGSVPLGVSAVEVLHEIQGELIPARQDWLLVEGAEKETKVAAGGALRIRLTVRPERRSDEEEREELCARVLRIRHDGWAQDGQHFAELKVEVKFPTTVEDETIWLGVDFGTSSSMVCVLRDSESAALILEPELGIEQLASLMYYAPTRKPTGASEPFLLGAAAKNSASINPANLVRSIKSIVARAPGTIFHFEPANRADGFQRYSTQQLLDHFISALRTRAESGVHRLPSLARQQLFQTGQHVRFRRAVFTHPVEVSEAMRLSLHGAARAARLDGGGSDPAQFLDNSCIDEATAAVLAYVFLRACKKLEGDFPVLDTERVLCFDVGGGTTDVAAVEVSGMADRAPVSVTLHATAGDSRFGGDNLDRYLAADLLRQVFKAADKVGMLVAITDYESALDARSLAEFKDTYRAPPGTDADSVYRMYRKASELRTKAEEAKRKLGTEKTVDVTLDGAGWPYRKSATNEHEGHQFKLKLAQEAFAGHVRAETLTRCAHLDQVVRNAGWMWSDVTTLLFTGQGTRVPAIRETVRGYVLKQREGAGPVPIVIEPDDGSGFDPKRCVALGAAVWGSSGESGWLEVKNRMSAMLTFDLQRKGGPNTFTKLVAAGSMLPAMVTVSFRVPSRQLELYKNDRAYVRFNWTDAATSAEVEVRGLADYWILVNGQHYLGVLV